MPSLWIVWLIITFITAIAEILSPTFGLIFVSGASLVTMVSSLFGAHWLFQIIFFGVVLILCLIFLRPRLNKKFGSASTPLNRVDRLIGLKGLVTESIDPIRATGRVLVHGEDWAARSGDPIPVGTEVIIDGSEGIVLTVSQIES